MSDMRHRETAKIGTSHHQRQPQRPAGVFAREHAHAVEKSRAPEPGPSTPIARILQLQRQVGNQAVMRHLALQGLRVSQPGDASEREAERVAAVVMNMMPATEDFGSQAEKPPEIQRACTHSGQTAQHHCADQQGAAASTEPPGPDIASRLHRLTGSGDPLPAPERTFFEPRFGTELGAVRVHTDQQADRLASDLAARAFTFGNHVVFRSGEFRPDTRAGRHLIAHELVHTVQQAGNRTIDPEADDIMRKRGSPAPCSCGGTCEKCRLQLGASNRNQGAVAGRGIQRQRDQFLAPAPSSRVCDKARGLAKPHDVQSTVLIVLLKLPITAVERDEIDKRVRELKSLFSRLTDGQAVQMSKHLNDPGNALARLFDCELDTTTRETLRDQLRRQLERLPDSPEPPTAESVPDGGDANDVTGQVLVRGGIEGSSGQIAVEEPEGKTDRPPEREKPDDPGYLLERAKELVQGLLAAGTTTAVAAVAAASLATLIAKAEALIGAEFTGLMSLLEFVDGQLQRNERALDKLRRLQPASYDVLNTKLVKLEHRGSIKELEQTLRQIEAIKRETQQEFVKIISARNNSTKEILSVLELERVWESPRAGYTVYRTGAGQLVGEHVALTTYAETDPNYQGRGWQSHHIVSETHLKLAGIEEYFPEYGRLPCVLLPPEAHLERFHGFLNSRTSTSGRSGVGSKLQGFDKPSDIVFAHSQAYDLLGDYTGAGERAIKRELMLVVKKMLGYIP